MAVLSAVVLLAGCPAPGTTKNPPDAPESGPPVVSVCYAPLITDRETEIAPVARAACAGAGVTDATLAYRERSFFLNECPLLKKVRISFICEAPAAD